MRCTHPSGGANVGRTPWICEIHGSRCAIYGSLARAGIHGCLRNLWILRRVRSTDLTVLNRPYLNLIFIYIIIRHCSGVGPFPRPFCVPNSVALASLTLQVGDWAIH